MDDYSYYESQLRIGYDSTITALSKGETKKPQHYLQKLRAEFWRPRVLETDSVIGWPGSFIRIIPERDHVNLVLSFLELDNPNIVLAAISALKYSFPHQDLAITALLNCDCISEKRIPVTTAHTIDYLRAEDSKDPKWQNKPAMDKPDLAAS